MKKDFEIESSIKEKIEKAFLNLTAALSDYLEKKNKKNESREEKFIQIPEGLITFFLEAIFKSFCSTGEGRPLSEDYYSPEDQIRTLTLIQKYDEKLENNLKIKIFKETYTKISCQLYTRYNFNVDLRKNPSHLTTVKNPMNLPIQTIENKKNSSTHDLHLHQADKIETEYLCYKEKFLATSYSLGVRYEDENEYKAICRKIYEAYEKITQSILDFTFLPKILNLLILNYLYGDVMEYLMYLTWLIRSPTETNSTHTADFQAQRFLDIKASYRTPTCFFEMINGQLRSRFEIFLSKLRSDCTAWDKTEQSHPLHHVNYGLSFNAIYLWHDPDFALKKIIDSTLPEENRKHMHDMCKLFICLMIKQLVKRGANVNIDFNFPPFRGKKTLLEYVFILDANDITGVQEVIITQSNIDLTYGRDSRESERPSPIRQLLNLANHHQETIKFLNMMAYYFRSNKSEDLDLLKKVYKENLPKPLPLCGYRLMEKTSMAEKFRVNEIKSVTEVIEYAREQAESGKTKFRTVDILRKFCKAYYLSHMPRLNSFLDSNTDFKCENHI